MNIFYRVAPFVIICSLFISLIAPASAQTIDRQFLIQSLLQQLALLQEQLRMLTVQTSPVRPVVPQKTYPATPSWEKRFVMSPSQIPTNAFRAFYFDVRNPTVVVYTEVVGGADTHYLPENGHLGSIKSDSFGGYWIGNYVFATSQKYTFHLSQGSSESRIRVDGIVIFEGTGSESVDYTFTPGTHKVEIEQVNKSWTSSGSTIFLLPWAKAYTVAELSAALAPLWKNSSAQVWLASPSDISGANRVTQIALKPTSVPTTLVLGSYIATTWVYPSNSQANIKAIVLSASDKGSSIKNVPPGIPVYILNERIESVSADRLVSICPVTEDYCSRDYDVRPAAAMVASFFGGKKPAGIGEISSARVLEIPVVTLDASAYAKLDADVAANEKARSEYEQSNKLHNIFQSY